MSDAADRPGSSAPSAASTDDLQFGDVRDHRSEGPPPASPLVPDQDGHLATARVVRPEHRSQQVQFGPLGDSAPGAADGGETAAVPTEVFIHLDPFLDMQAHAAEDTSIELGGLLLGRRGERADGTSWVVICDALRARHYRATRGSFRFTHDTWADLNRQRAELPESTEIVGWYHTHPGWGVFLSDQDIFICDHFFAGPDDVALVIDPTSGDTGLFVRRGSAPGRPPQRLAWYRLYSHRRRIADLHAWASFFSGVGTVSNPPAVFPSQHAAPIVVTSGGDGSNSGKSWFALAGALLGAQLAIGLALLVAVSGQVGGGSSSSPGEQLRVREAVVDDLLSRIAAEGPQGAARSWRETALENEQLRAANLGLLSRVDTLSEDWQADRLRAQQANLQLTAVRQELAEAESRLRALAAAPADEPAAGLLSQWRHLLAGAAAGLALGWLVASLLSRRSERGPAEKHSRPSPLTTEATTRASERFQ